ncbi:3-hydroxyacyl-ACP dehydratase FabZ family protein [Lutimonas sp.]|uniref:3-hydroxyacyl-ACP dehydratase FabZ family protein n=1 Tax=Lutimonas sp. TaxID=1872403 RepID=UPI003D9B9CDD
MGSDEIMTFLPYCKPFLFVDTLTHISEEGVTGCYTFDKDSYFYKGHFKDNPITPGVILTETMAQIGVVCLGIYLMRKELKTSLPAIALSSHEVDFYLPVTPGEKVTVVSEKQYFRFRKLKCQVNLYNEEGGLVCRGKIAGMIGSNNG